VRAGNELIYVNYLQCLGVRAVHELVIGFISGFCVVREEVSPGSFYERCTST